MSTEREFLVTSAPEVGPLLARLTGSLVQYAPHLTELGSVVYLDGGRASSLMRSMWTGHIEGWSHTKAMLPARGRHDGWKPENYIWNAKRYAVKAFVWWDIAEWLSSSDSVLVWLDADTEATAEIPPGFFAGLLGDADVAYLGRSEMHPETGCVVFRLPDALPLLRWCRQAYLSGAFREMADGWTDCHVLRAGLKATPQIAARDLTSHLHSGPWNSKVDAFALSPLGPYLKHHKGSARKREVLCGI